MADAVERRNMLAALDACVQSITDTHHGFAVDETDDMVEELCTILEVAMSHRLKATSRGSASFFRPETYSSVPSFWPLISSVPLAITDQLRTTISALPSARTHLGKQRIWLRMTLMEKTLAQCINALIVSDLSKFYEPEALMCSPEVNQLVELVNGVRFVDFNLCLKEETSFDDRSPPIIDYSRYISVRKEATLRRKVSTSELAPTDFPAVRPKTKLQQTSPLKAGGDDKKGKTSLSILTSLDETTDKLKTAGEQKKYLERQLAEMEQELQAERERRQRLEAKLAAIGTESQGS